MSDHAHGETHKIEKMRPMYFVWVGLLVLTLLEVFLAYERVPIHIMLVALLGMSVLKAAMIVAWFMHLKFERRSLVLTLIPAAVTCILLLDIVFPDSFRLKHLGVNRTGKAAHGEVHSGH